MLPIGWLIVTVLVWIFLANNPIHIFIRVFIAVLWLLVAPLLLSELTSFLDERGEEFGFAQGMRSPRQQFSTDLLNLLEDVHQHNKVIHDIKVLDQLKQAGHQIALVDRQICPNFPDTANPHR
jgi:hypothetical protein